MKTTITSDKIERNNTPAGFKDTAFDKKCFEKKRARLILYDFFKSILFYPHKDMVLSFRNSSIMQNICWAQELIDINSNQLLENMSNYMISENEGEILEDLSIEYTRLFINCYEGIVAVPYESFYKSFDKSVMGEVSVEVSQFYKTYGLEVSEEFTDPPDHIAVEMEFMTYLITKEIQTMDSSVDDLKTKFYHTGQRNFLKKHLSTWGELFFSKVLTNTENIFWREAAGLGNFFLKKEALWAG
ncbi:MAG: molecular chaperone TorD family protein [Deltaproteobacteria bacterium]|nr:molecular chaperone TorD family protein [Deltaproteobacteria bacterium]